MSSALITRSPGVPIGSGLTAGGGASGVTEALDAVVADAADRLAALYGGPVTIRFNSDRRSGGAWLLTEPHDRIGVNHEVGVTAAVVDGAVILNVAIDPLLDGGQPDGERYFRVGSLDRALTTLAQRVPGTFAEVVDRLGSARQAWVDQHVRYILIGLDRDSGVAAPRTPQGRESLLRRARSTAVANRAVRDGQVHQVSIRQHTISVGGLVRACVWRDATEVPLGSVISLPLA